MATLTPDQIKQVLSLVKDQPGFRNALISDPGTTLSSIGVAYDQSDLPTPPQQVVLPSDTAIQDKLDELTERVLLGMGVVRHLLQLDAD